uniref:Uncharacterized protein n=1 Tax=Rousettus aegyptiacus TaxID=9407 RepID=A0A7J8KBS3_ROUAE|nr:hypothetical protein HJG63_008069 [Rousettus aegyptiacus]
MTPRLLDTLCLLATSETRQSKYWEKRDDSSPQVLREEGPSFSAGAEGLSPVSFAAAERGDSLLLHCLSGGRRASPAVTEAGGFRLAVVPERPARRPAPRRGLPARPGQRAPGFSAAQACRALEVSPCPGSPRLVRWPCSCGQG